MADKKTLTLFIMDPSFENERTVTAFRIMDAAIRRGMNLNVFAYEGAVTHSFAKQQQHANAVHGRDVTQEDHPLTKDWVQALLTAAEKSGSNVVWCNCGLCVDERGVGEYLPGCKRGSPADGWSYVQSSDNTLVIPTR